MKETARDLLIKMPQMILDDQLTEITDHFAFPLTVFVRDQMITLITPEHARTVLSRYRAFLLDNGAVSAHSRVIDSMPTEKDRSIYTTHTVFRDADGKEISETLVRHAAERKAGGGLQIDVIRYIRTPLGLTLDRLVPMAAIA